MSNATGTVLWTTYTSCATSNNGYANASLDGTTSQYLTASNFGFSIPTTATINGITVGVERHSSGTGNGGIDDAAVRIIKGGTIGATNATLLTDWPTTVDTYYTYGSSSSLWGETWTPADINAANFGFALSATKSSAAGAAITASVDHIRITVTYTTADGNTYDICLTKDGSTCTGTEKTNQSLNQTTDTTTTKGGASDLWSATLSPSDVTSSNFGVMIQDANAVASALNFDQVQLKIDYTTPVDSQIPTGYSGTYSQNPDLVKDSDGNIQLVWESWSAEGLTPGVGGASWRAMTQKLDNPSSGSFTKQYPSTSSDTWASSGTMSNARGSFSGITLSSGKVLVSGGVSGGSWTSTAELYDPHTGTWTLTGPMNGAMTNHRLYNLPNGSVIAAANIDGQSNYLYSPEANTWTLTGSLITSRSSADSIQLNNGKVLLVGGCNLACSTVYSSSELYNPSTGTWTQTSTNMPAALAFTKLVKLNDGSVLAMGGCETGPDCNSNYTFTTAIYKYNPDTEVWSHLGDLPSSMRSVRAITLNSGKVLITGGEEYDGSVSVQDANYHWTFDPYAGTYTSLSPTASMPSNGGILLSSGSVLGITSTTTTFVFDPSLEQWSDGPSLSTARTTPFKTLLKTGKVLLVGGSNTTSSAELYTPDPSEKLIAGNDQPGTNHQTGARISADIANGTAYVAWTDSRVTAPTDTTGDKNIFMQRLNSSGNPTWPNGTGTNGTYNVRDVRVNNTRGELDTSSQVNVSIAKSIYNNNNDDGTYPLHLAWVDTKDQATMPLNIYTQSYDTRDRTMSSTTWTAYYYVTGSPSNTNSIKVQVGAVESDGETASYTSAESTYTGDGTNGEKSTVFSNLPPSGETTLTHRRIIMKLTRSTGSMQIQYNGSAGVADTRLNTGMVVPERTLMLALLIPLLPGLVFYNGRRRAGIFQINKGSATKSAGKK